jgi:hypothetical protein
VVVYAADSRAALLSKAMPRPCVRVVSRAQLVAEIARRPRPVVFVDAELLDHLEGEHLGAPVVAVLDGGPPQVLPRTIELLDTRPWLAHCISASMLSTPLGKPYLAMFMDQLFEGPEQGLLSSEGVGRVAKIARASKREHRFERMHAFFAKHGLSERAIRSISDVSEELVMNALYDAPVEAGYFKEAVPRTRDVELPHDLACQISYGIEHGNAFVRLRDPFGAFTRDRLLEVLNRCNSTSVPLDESRGGAGLGLWRIFSTATTISITVIPGRLTEISIGMAIDKARIVKQLRAVDLFFAPKTYDWLDSVAITNERDMFEQSVTLLLSS